MTTFPDRSQCWWPVAIARELSADHPMRRQLNGLPLVLFRTDELTPAALVDACPHRMAPLSQGQCTQGQIQCPYHGWTFDGQGRCVRIPGMQDVHALSRRPLVRTLGCVESAGLIWVQTEAGAPLKLPTESIGVDQFFMQSTVDATLLDIAENFLEAFHTHFVHRGLVRRDTQRQQVDALLRPIDGGLEVAYQNEQTQNGWLSRLFEPSRGVSWGRFLWPNLAQIEYHDAQQRLTLRVDLWITPVENERHQLFARISTRRGVLPARVKQMLLTPLFRRVLQQDIAITEAVTHNRRTFKQHPDALMHGKPLDARHDLMGPALRTLFEQQSNGGIVNRQATLYL